MSNGHPATRDRHLRTLFSLGATGQLSDGQLLERFSNRPGEPSELAFAALVERHGSMVLRVARSVLRDEHSAHDAFQATFLILARKARSLWVRDSIGPWLHAVAYRTASDHRSAGIRRARHERISARPESYQPRQPDRDDLARAIHEEIARLPDRYRSAVVLCHLESLTQQEAAHQLGWPVGTLQSRLARGREKLRDRLTRRGLTPGALGVIPPISAPGPLVIATARAAATISTGGPIAGTIGPAVLALIQTSSKGMLMTKLKLGAVALVMAGGMVVSTTGQGFWPNDVPTGESAPETPARAIEPKSETDKANAIPPPADGRGFPYLLEFFETQSVVGLKNHQDMAALTRAGYPIKSYEAVIHSDGPSPGMKMANQYQVHAYPTILLVDGVGQEIARIGALEGPAKIAAFYNENRTKAQVETIISNEYQAVDNPQPLRERTNDDRPEEPVFIGYER
ncbi:RNA polymerase sigma factor [Tundrisphaera lichenicola]|uniref:RNA polymerase sigma factor n=1 Tax=Tundrisphaera lichenicola TaxID=2029860 RepID=UPI003EB9BF33